MTILDGYNLLFRDAAPDASLEDLRHDFLRKVDAARRSGQRVVVVFDGVPGIRARSEGGQGLEIRYSRSPRSADDLIVSLVRKAPRGQTTVLTRDRELAHRVKSAGGQVGDPAEFFRLPSRRRSGPSRTEKPPPPSGAQLDEWERLFDPDRDPPAE